MAITPPPHKPLPLQAAKTQLPSSFMCASSQTILGALLWTGSSLYGLLSHAGEPPKRTQDSRCCLTSAEWRGINLSLASWLRFTYAI